MKIADMIRMQCANTSPKMTTCISFPLNLNPPSISKLKLIFNYGEVISSKLRQILRDKSIWYDLHSAQYLREHLSQVKIRICIQLSASKCDRQQFYNLFLFNLTQIVWHINKCKACVKFYLYECIFHIKDISLEQILKYTGLKLIFILVLTY